jgi:hypothetical protein
VGPLVTGSTAAQPPGETARTHPVTLVWIDAREAIIVRWVDGSARVAQVTSDVPARHRSTGAVRHDPGVRHGGGGAPRSDERRRLEHLARYLTTVAQRLPPEDDLVLIGPATLHERLARRQRAQDRRHGVVREVVDEAAPRLTRRQLVARLRQEMGVETRRRTQGGHRWSTTPGREASGRHPGGRVRAHPKPASRSDAEAAED